MKYVLLARPSSLIVNDMQKLISATGCEPKPLSSVDEFEEYNAEDVAGIVISTALSSKVKDKYWDVVKKSLARFPGKPIFLASYSSVKSTVIIAGKRLEENNIPLEMVSIDDTKPGSFDPLGQLVILTQKEISDDVKFPDVLHVVKSLLRGKVLS